MDAARPIIPSGFESASPGDAAPRATPVMEQYIEIKAANPDCLLFYRMGDFYELFFEDAEIAARALGIVLTKRGKHLGRDIPMCGVPIHRGDEYLNRLIALARARASVGEESRFALAWIDISTGEFRIAECDRSGLGAEIARLEPGEIVVSDALYSDSALAPYLRSLPAVTPLPRDVFDGATAERRLAAYFGLATTESFGALSRLELTAAAACISYIERTQLGGRPPLSPPVREAPGATLSIDQATRSNLELVRTDRKSTRL